VIVGSDRLADLAEAWGESNRALDRLLARVDPTLARSRQALLDELAKLPRNADGTLRGARVAELLRGAGVRERLMAALGDLLAQAPATAEPLLSAVGLSVPPISRRAQLVFAEQADEAVKDVLGSLSEGLSGLLREAASTPIDARSLADLASGLTDLPLAQARTVANTAIAGLQRQTVAQASTGLPGGKKKTWWLYVGPDDGATRPFCHALVGRAVQDSDMHSLRNGQGLTVRDYGGGYNCRHSWIPVTEAYLKAAGVPRGSVQRANAAGRR